MGIIIAPSLLAADMGNLERDIGLLEPNGIEVLHVDAMDGDFVPNIAFGPDQVKMLKPYTRALMDVHMMISDPDRFVDAYVQAGADHVTVHAEACTHLHRSLQRIRGLGVTAGVALCPATSLEAIRYVLDMADLVLVMTVNPGYGGQKNIPSMKRKARDLKRMREEEGHSFQIQVDGGIQQDNLMEYIEAGADNLVIGSAVFQKGKTDENLKKFNGMIMNVN